MFLRKTRGLLDFIATAFCLWAALYHTPAGALVRSVAAHVSGQRTTAGPLLSYFTGGAVGPASPRVEPAHPMPQISTPGGGFSLPASPSVGLGQGIASLLETAKSVDPQAARVAMHLGGDASSPRALASRVEAGEHALGSADLAVLALFAGDEPVRYARDRLTASGLDLTLENAARQLPPGFEGDVVLASQAMTFGVAFGLGWPVSASARVTSPFGSRVDPVTGRQQVHTGVDLGLPEGTAVHAVAAGVVRRAGEDAVCGRLVVVDHGHGVTTAYCHNARVKVSAGQTLAAGDVIAWSGNTGRSTGPHLHYQLALLDHPVDPFSFHARPPVTPSGGSL